MFVCDTCNSAFASRRNLKRHFSHVHKKQVHLLVQGDFDKYVNKCILGCKISFRFKINLIMHLKDKHNIIINKEEWIFTSFEEFTSWFNQITNKENCRYIKHNSLKPTKNKLRVYLHCSYSGKESYTRAHLRTPRIKKLNFACTSYITVTVWFNNVTVVEYWKDHYGHLEDLTKLNLKALKSICISQKCVDSKNKPLMRGNMISCPLKSNQLKIKKNFIEIVMNLKHLNDHQLNKIYWKSMYLKRYINKIVTKKNDEMLNTSTMRKSKDIQLQDRPLVNSLDFLKDFLIF